jgi:uncharacterized membrane protein YkvI
MGQFGSKATIVLEERECKLWNKDAVKQWMGEHGFNKYRGIVITYILFPLYSQYHRYILQEGNRWKSTNFSRCNKIAGTRCRSRVSK